MAQPLPPSFQPAHPTNKHTSGQPLPPSQHGVDHKETDYQNNPFIVALDGISGVFKYAKSIAIILIVLSILGFLGNAASSVADVLTQESQEQTAASISTPEASPLNETQVISLIAAIGAILIIATIIVFIISSFIKGIGDAAAAATANQKEITFGQAVSTTLRRFPGYLLLQLLIAVKLFLWSLLLIVPAIVMSVRYSLAGTAYFARDMKATEALKYSTAITKDGWFTTFASMGLFNVVTLGLLSGLSQIGTQSILFRQFDIYHTKNQQKPGPHGLSIAFFVICVLLVLSLLLLSILTISFWLGSVINSPS